MENMIKDVTEKWNAMVADNMTRRSEAERLILGIRCYFNYIRYNVESNEEDDEATKRRVTAEVMRLIEKEVDDYCAGHRIAYADEADLASVARCLNERCYRGLYENYSDGDESVETEQETRDGKYLVSVQMDKDGTLVRALDEDSVDHEDVAQGVKRYLESFDELLGKVKAAKEDEWMDRKDMDRLHAEMDRKCFL